MRREVGARLTRARSVAVRTTAAAACAPRPCEDAIPSVEERLLGRCIGSGVGPQYAPDRM
jgi:hypothetical protein